jgi:hypothetical protein
VARDCNSCPAMDRQCDDNTMSAAPGATYQAATKTTTLECTSLQSRQLLLETATSAMTHTSDNAAHTYKMATRTTPHKRSASLCQTHVGSTVTCMTITAAAAEAISLRVCNKRLTLMRHHHHTWQRCVRGHPTSRHSQT